MRQQTALAKCIDKHCYNALFEAVKEFMDENLDNLDLRTDSISYVDEVELLELYVEWTRVYNRANMGISIDVFMDSDIRAVDRSSHGDKDELCHKRFLVKIDMDLAVGFDSMKIKNVEYYSWYKPEESAMDNSLVPIIRKDQYEEVAHQFLKDFYAKPLLEPMAVDPMELAKAMGLTVQIRRITKDASIFGRLYFYDCESELYDEKTDSMQVVPVPGKTIMVDPQMYFLYNLGAVNNTIVHECVHWGLHRKAFELEKLFNKELTQINCQVSGGIKGTKREAVDWMEMQANALAPRVQMPMGTFKAKASEFIKFYRAEKDIFELVEVMEPVIDALATFFCVSRQAAKIRMLDAGYNEALGAFTYVDDHYVRPHTWKKDSIERNQTFCIGEVDAAIMSLTNPDFEEKIKSGRYLYVDSHFVLKTPKYVQYNIFGDVELTEYARYHMDECCLVFDISIKEGRGYDSKYLSECLLNRAKESPFEFNIQFHKGYQHSTPDKQLEFLEKEEIENAKMLESLNNNYLECWQKLIDWRGETCKGIAEDINVNEKTVRRIINGETEGSIETIVLMCLALYLPYDISQHMLRLSPFNLTLSNENHRWYRIALQYYTGKSIDEIRRELLKKNITL